MGCMTSTSGTFVCRTTAKDMVATSPGSPTSSTGYALGLLSAKRRTSFFCFQAKDGIRAYKVTGVQTCALPILHDGRPGRHANRAEVIGQARHYVARAGAGIIRRVEGLQVCEQIGPQVVLDAPANSIHQMTDRKSVV